MSAHVLSDASRGYLVVFAEGSIRIEIPCHSHEHAHAVVAAYNVNPPRG